MRKIPLSDGQFAIVDDADYAKISKWKWHCRKNKTVPVTNLSRAEAIAEGIQPRNGSQRIQARLHRIIMGRNAKLLICHINSNQLDCRRKNLQWATLSQAMANSLKKGAKKSSKYVGVTRREKRWVAQIGGNNKYQNLGMFDTQKQAALAYDQAATARYGEFAKLNFPKAK